jgi:toxin ParE1/3/4
MKLVFTLAARADLRSISEFIAENNPRRAMTFIDELEQHCSTLAARPRAHPVLLGHESSGVRKAVHRNYLIFYREVESTVEILHASCTARAIGSCCCSGKRIMNDSCEAPVRLHY